jgi:hypothetical protein
MSYFFEEKKIRALENSRVASRVIPAINQLKKALLF